VTGRASAALAALAPLLPSLAFLSCMGLAHLTAACDGPGDRSAEALWPKYCVRCHGEDGRGVAKQLARYPNADLTRSRARGGGARAFFERRIAQGYGPMPGFSRRLSRQELERLVNLSLKLAGIPETVPPRPSDDHPPPPPPTAGS